jgi:hypothetical protein
LAGKDGARACRPADGARGWPNTARHRINTAANRSAEPAACMHAPCHIDSQINWALFYLLNNISTLHNYRIFVVNLSFFIVNLTKTYRERAKIADSRRRRFEADRRSHAGGGPNSLRRGISEAGASPTLL